MKLIRDGHFKIYEFVKALNNSDIPRDGSRKSALNDLNVRAKLQLAIRHCSGGVCLDSVRNLLSFIYENPNTPNYKVGKNCNFIYLNTLGDKYITGINPPCWRDYMIAKVGGML